jgi:hypothetical protein
MSDDGDRASSRKRARQAPDLDKAPIALWLTAIVALAAAAGVGYWVFGRDDPTPPSQGAALTIGDAADVLVTPAEAGPGLVEPPEDAEITVLSLADADAAAAAECVERLTDAGFLAWDPMAGGTDDALARRVLVSSAGAALSQEVGPWSADDLADVRDAVADCPEVPLSGGAGAGTARLSVRDPAGEVGDDAIWVDVAIATEGSGAVRAAAAEVWVRDDLSSAVARSGAAGTTAGAPPVDDARLGALVTASDARLETALESVS